jgi:hypothetical protein
MAIVLASKPGLTSASALSIPKTWDSAWFRGFINNLLKGGDVRNAIAGPGITITGNISSPYATISATGGTISDITSTGGSITVTNSTGPTTNIDLHASGVTAGSYTDANITVNADGIITAASNGSSGGGGTISDITSTGGSITITNPTGPTTNIEQKSEAASLTSPGYQTIFGGLIVQWGTQGGGGGGATPVTFPIAFPTSCFVVVGQDINVQATVLITSITASGFTVTNGAGGSSTCWIALGH